MSVSSDRNCNNHFLDIIQSSCQHPNTLSIVSAMGCESLLFLSVIIVLLSCSKTIVLQVETFYVIKDGIRLFHVLQIFIMYGEVVFYPGRIHVVFRKGPLGHLLLEPTEEAKRIKDNRHLRERSAPGTEDRIKDNAPSLVRQRGGDTTDQREVYGEYTLQFGKYKGKSFRWLLENDLGYSMYLIKNVQREEAAGVLQLETARTAYCHLSNIL